MKEKATVSWETFMSQFNIWNSKQIQKRLLFSEKEDQGWPDNKLNSLDLNHYVAFMGSCRILDNYANFRNTEKWPINSLSDLYTNAILQCLLCYPLCITDVKVANSAVHLIQIQCTWSSHCTFVPVMSVWQWCRHIFESWRQGSHCL